MTSAASQSEVEVAQRLSTMHATKITVLAMRLALGIGMGLVGGKTVQAGFINETASAGAVTPVPAVAPALQWMTERPRPTPTNGNGAHGAGANVAQTDRQQHPSANANALPVATATLPPAAPSVAMHWEVRASDMTLRQALMRWAIDAGWQVAWEIRYDYPVQLESSFSGTFEDALEQFIGSLRYSDYPILACLYEGNHVIRILHYGDKKRCGT